MDNHIVQPESGCKFRGDFSRRGELDHWLKIHITTVDAEAVPAEMFDLLVTLKEFAQRGTFGVRQPEGDIRCGFEACEQAENQSQAGAQGR